MDQSYEHLSPAAWRLRQPDDEYFIEAFFPKEIALFLFAKMTLIADGTQVMLIPGLFGCGSFAALFAR